MFVSSNGQVYLTWVEFLNDTTDALPHHSSAIMVSEQATFEDPETEKLATEIIEAQKRKIAQMKKILYRLENGGEAQNST